MIRMDEDFFNENPQTGNIEPKDINLFDFIDKQKGDLNNKHKTNKSRNE